MIQDLICRRAIDMPCHGCSVQRFGDLVLVDLDSTHFVTKRNAVSETNKLRGSKATNLTPIVSPHWAFIYLRPADGFVTLQLTMVSRLESVPYDVLLNVAFFTTYDRVIGSPSNLPSLLLTSRALYRELSVGTCPHLYSRLFYHQFDTARTFTNNGTSTILANEYVARHQLLHRSRFRSWSSDNLLGDLRCALRMVIESDGVNELHLAAANFPEQLIGLTEAYLPESTDSKHSRELKHLLVWLLSLSISRGMCFSGPYLRVKEASILIATPSYSGDIAKISSERLEYVCLLLHRFAMVCVSLVATDSHVSLTVYVPDIGSPQPHLLRRSGIPT